MPSPGQSALKFLRSNLRRGQKPKVRIAVLGQASVGKTALIVRYCTGPFIDDYSPEIAKVYQHQTVMNNHEEVSMDIWDTAGYFQSDAELRHLEVFIRWADVVVLVYSITDLASFNLVWQLTELIRPRPVQKRTCSVKGSPPSPLGLGLRVEANKTGFEHCENCPDLPLMLVGTKTDLESCRQVSGTAVQALLNRFGGSIKHQEISTKENMEEVVDVFESALRSGWLFRQHRELTKHRNMTIYSAGPVGQGLERAFSFDGSSPVVRTELWNTLNNPSPPYALSGVGVGVNVTHAKTDSARKKPPSHTRVATGRERKMSLQPCSTSFAVAAAPAGSHKHLVTNNNNENASNLNLNNGLTKCQTILSNIKKCIVASGGKPLFQQQQQQRHHHHHHHQQQRPIADLKEQQRNNKEDFAENSKDKPERSGDSTKKEKNKASSSFRCRANTDSRLCKLRSKSLSVGETTFPQSSEVIVI